MIKHKGFVGCALALALGGCSQAQVTAALTTPAGQLFCGVQTVGGPIVVKVVQAAVAGADPTLAPIAIIATNATAAYVNMQCAKAGGVPVSPPANPDAAPVVAVPIGAVAPSKA